MLVGYARVSTTDQNLDLQTDALKAAGCERIFNDSISGAKADRPGLNAALALCRKGDTLVVWRLDRLGRSLPHLVETVRWLEGAGVGFKSLRESIDTTTSGGKLVFHLFASLAEFERDVIRERTNAGLLAARARGRMGGRPKGVVDPAKRDAALALRNDTTRSVSEICRILGVSRNTYYKYVRSADTAAPASAATGAKATGDNSGGGCQSTEGARTKSTTPRRSKGSGREPDPPPRRVMRVNIHLRVEGNNKYIRTKRRVRALIEDQVFGRFGMEKPDPEGYDYVLSVPYQTDEELNEAVWEILSEANDLADSRNCFVEADARAEDGSERPW